MSAIISDDNKCKGWSDLEMFTDDRRFIELYDDASFHRYESNSLSHLLMRKMVSWMRNSLERLSIRLTLENVSVLAIILAILMPRAITYILVYPIFRLVFGTLYPAYASYKAVRTKNVKEYVKWMMYWIVFALFTCAETFTDVFFSFWFPFYYEIKIILVLWLLSPATKGSSILYRRFVHPALSRREAEIDDALARATEQGYTAVLQLGTKGVNYATTVLMQTAIKGGGGLVQQLRKSYSLSDLTGEKEDENQNTEHSPDEVDLDEPRRREGRGRRGYSPRRTQSSSNRMEMYFSEVDVDLRQSRSKEPVGTLTNIKSSDDISSGYSSGEALQSQRNSITSEHLVRTSSVGGRNRTKPKSITKKSPEVEEVQEEEELAKNIQQLSISNPLSLLSISQRYEILSFLFENMDYIKILKNPQNLSDSDDDSSTLKADSLCVKLEDKKRENSMNSVIDVKVEGEKIKQSHAKNIMIDFNKINNDIYSDRLDDLKELLHNMNKVLTTIVSSQENLSELSNTSTNSRLSMNQKTSNLLNINKSPTISRSNSDCSERAGKYNKKPAPQVPEIAKEEKKEEEKEEKALKATLVIKTETVKSLTGNDAVDAFIKRRKKSNAKTAAKESFSKLLTIPKNIFHNAFHKEKEEDTKSIASQKLRSRSGSYENVKSELDLTTVLLDAINEERKKSREGDTYINLKSDSIDCDFSTSQTSNKEQDIKDHRLEKIQKDKTIV